jgi:hypothetical protein
MKKLSIIIAAIFLGFSGAVMAADSGENHQDDTNSRGPNPYMSYSGGNYQRGAYRAFAQHPVRHHVVNPHVQR